MKKKSFDGLSGQLSRTQMKAITAGRPVPEPGDPGCGSCTCSGGARALYYGGDPNGPHCWCPDGSSISCPFE